jgi:hypothetical protein
MLVSAQLQDLRGDVYMCGCLQTGRDLLRGVESV